MIARWYPTVHMVAERQNIPCKFAAIFAAVIAYS